jgi:Type IV secretion system pilin
MRSKFRKVVYVGMGLLFLPPSALASVDSGAGDARASSAPKDLFGPTGIFHTIANVLIYIVGAVAVIMLILGGFRYVTSQGDAGAVKQAKDTILYGIIGVVVAILAFAIVSFIATSIK